MKLEFLKVNEDLTYIIKENVMVASIKKQENRYICTGWMKYPFRKIAESYDEAYILARKLIENVNVREKKAFLTKEEMHEFKLEMLEKAETFILVKDCKGVSTMKIGFDFLDSLRDSISEYGDEGEYVINLSGYNLHIVDYDEVSSFENTPKIIKLHNYHTIFYDETELLKMTIKTRDENDELAEKVLDFIAKNLRDEELKYTYHKKEIVYERTFEFQVEVETERNGTYMQYAEIYLKTYNPQEALNRFKINKIALVKNINITCSVFYEIYR